MHYLGFPLSGALVYLSCFWCTSVFWGHFCICPLFGLVHICVHVLFDAPLCVSPAFSALLCLFSWCAFVFVPLVHFCVLLLVHFWCLSSFWCTSGVCPHFGALLVFVLTLVHFCICLPFGALLVFVLFLVHFWCLSSFWCTSVFVLIFVHFVFSPSFWSTSGVCPFGALSVFVLLVHLLL